MKTLGQRIKELAAQKVLTLPANHDRRGFYMTEETDEEWFKKAVLRLPKNAESSMTIIHEAPAHEGSDPVVFAALGGFTCSICAPTGMTKIQIEDFAATQFPGRWESIDKSKLKMGSPTPNPCNQAPDRRTHWFMMWVEPR